MTTTTMDDAAPFSSPSTASAAGSPSAGGGRQGSQVSIQGVHKVFRRRGQTVEALAQRRPRHRARRVHQPARPVGVRQVDAAAGDRRAHRARRRHRRHRRRQPDRGAQVEAVRVGPADAGARAVGDRREERQIPVEARLEPPRGPRAAQRRRGRRADRHRRSRPLPQVVSARTLGRNAAACVARAWLRRSVRRSC